MSRSYAIRSNVAGPAPLAGRTFRAPARGAAAAYCAELLGGLGARVVRGEGGGTAVHPIDLHPDLEWAHSGAMALTGRPGEDPRLAPGPLASCARGAVDALAELAGDAWSGDVDGASLLGERAALLGLERGGAVAPGGSCRLLRAADGWIAVNLARDDDLRSLPAWLGEGDTSDPWAFAAERLAALPVAGGGGGARLLELPVAGLASPVAEPGAWLRVSGRGGAGLGEARPQPTRLNEVVPKEPAPQKLAPQAPERGASRDAPLVVDLSALWAGPLCGHLLALAGARVVKVESTRRPDGARRGPSAFFDLLNAGKASVALDFTSSVGRNTLHALLERADIVIESARPRALSQLGIDAARFVATRSGPTWVSITGYGRTEPEANWVAFGDDAAVAAGLSAVPARGADSGPLFCGDAIADPLTGVHAAVAALAFHRGGGGALLDISLRGVVAHTLGFRAVGVPLCGRAEVRRVSANGADGDGSEAAYEAAAGSERRAVAPPRARAATGVAPSLGADTGRVLQSLGIPC